MIEKLIKKVIEDTLAEILNQDDYEIFEWNKLDSEWNKINPIFLIYFIASKIMAKLSENKE